MLSQYFYVQFFCVSTLIDNIFYPRITNCDVSQMSRDTGSMNGVLKARKKNVLVLVIGRVDFDANKKNAGRQIREKYRVRYFLHLSIIGIHVHLHSESLT